MSKPYIKVHSAKGTPPIYIMISQICCWYAGGEDTEIWEIGDADDVPWGVIETPEEIARLIDEASGSSA